ncbi:hypothetical protein [Embleya sp. AB8]|uniref:hypothetical protein n=1 Tax=Embleya sp. AB8 TaxID=3156304 RepID=UPI003C75E68F
MLARALRAPWRFRCSPSVAIDGAGDPKESEMDIDIELVTEEELPELALLIDVPSS